jgi:hypothetical protein
VIPRTLHYCWFGGAKPDLVRRCVNSFRVAGADFEVIEWNEDTLDLPDCLYVRRCLEERRWAHLSDFAQAWVTEARGVVGIEV